MPLIDYRLKEQELFNIADSLLSFEYFKTQEEYNQTYIRYQRLHPEDWLIVRRHYEKLNKEKHFSKGIITEEQYRLFLEYPEFSHAALYEEILKRSGTSYLKTSRKLRIEVRKELKEKAQEVITPEMERIFNVPTDQSYRIDEVNCPWEPTCNCFGNTPVVDESSYYDVDITYVASNCCNDWNIPKTACGEGPAPVGECDYFFQFSLNALDDAYCLYFWSADDMDLYDDISDAYQNYLEILSGSINYVEHAPQKSTAKLVIGRRVINWPFGYDQAEVKDGLKLVYQELNPLTGNGGFDCFSINLGLNIDCIAPN